MSEEKQNQDESRELEDRLTETAEEMAIANGIAKLEIVKRNGKAPDVFEADALTVNSTIEAPYEYYAKRGNVAWFDRNKAYLLVNYSESQIIYETEPIQENKVVVNGRIKINPRIMQLNLSEFGRKRWDETTFVNLIKSLRPYFTDSKNALELISSIKNIKVRVDTIIQKEDNQRGNKGETFKQVADTDLIHSFALELPLFVGGNAEDIVLPVELYYDYNASAGGLEFWVESKEYEEIIEPRIKALIDEQVDKFEDALPVLYV